MSDDKQSPAQLAAELAEARRRIAALEAAQAADWDSEAKYAGLIEACPDAVVMCNEEGQVLFASRHTRELLGLSPADPLIGQSVLAFVVESDRQRLAANLCELLKTGIRRNTEYMVLRKDGGTVPTEASSSVIRDPAGRPKAIMAIIRDISAHHQTCAALQAERRTLEHMLQASDHERQLIADEIHEGLAQYLPAALMQFQTYLRLRSENREEATKVFEAGRAMIQESLDEARRLISDVRSPLLDESGVVAALAHMVYDLRGRKGPAIEFQSAVEFDRLAPIVENTVYRIAQEGLNNAWKHSKAPQIELVLAQVGDRVRIEIRDDGVGFDPQTAPGGHFGLESIRERARLLGGEALIQSHPGQGTRVVVTLPIVDRKETVIAGEDASVDWPEALRNVAGDEGLLRQITEEALREIPACLARMEEALAAGNTKALGQASHTLKSAVRHFGATRTFDRASYLEQIADDKTSVDTASALAALRQEIDRVLAALRKHLPARER